MFNNPGRQIQIIAKFIFVVLLVALSAIGFFVVTSFFSNSQYYFFILAAVIVLGILISGLSVLFMYAVGTLIENVELIKLNTQFQLEQINILVGIARSIAIQNSLSNNAPSAQTESKTETEN